MAGPKKPKSEQDAIASFFGDDDLEWFDDEHEEGGAPRAARPSADPAPSSDLADAAGLADPAASDAGPDGDPGDDDDDAGDRETVVEAEVVEDVADPGDASPPEVAAAEASGAGPEDAPTSVAEAGLAAEDDATVEAESPAPEGGPDADEGAPASPVGRARPGAPPPPPPFLGGQSVVPRTERRPVTPPAASGPASRPSTDGPVMGDTPVLPDGAAYWTEARRGLEAEAEARGADGASWWIAAARVALRRQGDAEAAHDLLTRVDAPGLDPSVALEAARARVELAEARGGLGLAEALAALGDVASGAEAADALRGAASSEADAGARRALLARAVEADPTDHVAWSRWIDALEEAGDAEALSEALRGLAERVDPRVAARLQVRRAEAAKQAGHPDLAAEVLGVALEEDPHLGAARVASAALATERGDPAALARGYESEATHDATGVLHLVAARAWSVHGGEGDAASTHDRSDRAREAYDRAVEAGVPGARLERQARWLRAGDHEALQADLAAEIADQGEEAGAHVRYAHLALLEAGDADPAIRRAAWKAAVDAGGVAAEAGYDRALERDGDAEEVLARWQEVAEAGGDAALAARVKLAWHVATRRPSTGGDAGAVQPEPHDAWAAWDALLAAVPEERALAFVRLDALAAPFDARVTAAQAGALAEAAAGVAGAASTPRFEAIAWSEAADRHREAGDAARAAEAWGRAVGLPDEAVAAAMRWRRAEALAASDRLDEAAAAFVAIEEAVEGWEGAALALAAARSLASRPGGASLAAEAVARAATADPGARVPAILRDWLSDQGDVEAWIAAWRQDGRPDARLAAAAFAVVHGLDAPELDEPVGPFLTLAAWRGLAADDGGIDVAVARQVWGGASEADPRVALGLAFAEAGADPEAARSRLAGLAPQGRAAARLAEALGDPELALHHLAADDTAPARERARLAAAGAGDDAAALEALRAYLDEGDEVVALEVAERAGAAGDDVLHRQAAEHLAAQAGSEVLRAAARASAGALAATQGDPAAAADHLAEALRLRPGSRVLRDNALAAAAQVDPVDGDPLVALLDELRVPAAVRARWLTRREAGGGEALDPEITAAWAEAAGVDDPFAEVQLEQRLAADEAWEALYDAVATRLEHVRAPSLRAILTRRRRWLLETPLAGTDAGWARVQALVASQGDDPDLLRLGIRHARATAEDGTLRDEARAIAWLGDLARFAEDPAEAAAHAREVAALHLAAGRTAEARQAFLDALDHHSSDREALAGLRELAEQSGDRQALLGVLEREASLDAEGGHALDVRRRIAEIREQDEEASTDVAVDAWRAVLAVQPQDRQALERLLDLASRRDDPDLFLEIGEQLVAALDPEESPAERAALWRRMGRVRESQGRPAEAIERYERAVRESAGDVEAAERLEALYRDDHDWDGVVRALAHQAGASDDPVRRREAWRRAAQTALEHNQDRAGAVGFYENLLETEPTDTEALRFLTSWRYDTEHVGALALHERLEPSLDDIDEDDFDEQLEAASFCYRYATLLLREGQTDPAVARFERALSFNPTHLPSLEAVGPLYVAAERWDEAGDVYRRILRLTGGQGDKEQVARTYTMLGRVDLARADDGKAFKRFSKALEVFPHYVAAHRGQAAVHESRQEWQSALTAWNQVIMHASEPEDIIDGYLTKGRILDQRLQRADKAHQHYERSVAFHPDQPEAHLRLAELSLRQDQWEASAEYATRGLDLGQTAWRPSLLAVRAVARHLLEQREGAEADWRDALATGALDGVPEGGLAEPDAVRAWLTERVL